MITLTNVAELAACPEAGKRLGLLTLAKRLSRGARPLSHPTDLLRISLDAYSRGTSSMGVLVGEENDVWTALDQPERVGQRCRDGFAAQNIEDEEVYRKMHTDGRDGLQLAVKTMSKADRLMRLRHASALCKYYFESPDFLKEMFRGIFDGLGRPEFSGREQELLRELEPWRFFSAAMSAGIWNRAVKTNGFGWRSNAGGVDTKQAIYLAFCDVFVTADEPQRRVLKPISKLGHTRRTVLSYRGLRARLK